MPICRCVLIVSLLLAGTMSAGQAHVDTADVNGDGVVSLHELRAAYYADPEFNRRIEQSFAFFDADGNGEISAEERRRGKARLEAEAAAPAVVQTERPQVPDAGELAPLAVETTRRRVTTARQPPAAAQTPAVMSTSDRMLAWIADIDTDKSGGASRRELIESGGGKAWFQERDFDAADRDGNGDLNAEELAALVRSQERRRH